MTLKSNDYGTRIKYIDILRGISIILMIMGHVDFGSLFDHYIHVFHMPVWFFITGWFYKEQFFSADIIKKKAQQLITPYIAFGVIQYPIWLIFNRSVDNKLEPLFNLLWINTNLVMPVAGALWFLTCLFFAEIIFLLLKTHIRNEFNFALVCVGIVSIGHAMPQLFQLRLPWAMDVSFVAIGFMWIGYMAKKFQNNRIVKRILNLKIPEIIIGVFVNLVMCFFNGYVNLRTGEYSNIVLFWVNATSAILLLWNVSKILDKWCSDCNFVLKEIKYIGKNSIVYLVLNQLCILFFNKAANRVVGVDDAKFIMIRFAVVILTLFILHVAAYIVNSTKLRILIGKGTNVVATAKKTKFSV